MKELKKMGEILIERRNKMKLRYYTKESLYSFQLCTGAKRLVFTKADPRLVSCRIGSEKFKFLVDSGATVNTMTMHGWLAIKQNCHTAIQELELKPKEVLKGYANDCPLQLHCSFKTFIKVEDSERPAELNKFFVVKGTELPLLSYQTAMDLKLLRIGLKESPKGEVLNLSCNTHGSSEEANQRRVMGNITPTEFPKVPIEPVKFKIDDTVSPKQIIRYNVPKAFEKSINERLNKMETDGIIERADQENAKISSVSPLVLVPKGTNDFRIVVDYREVNKAIIREPYPMPSLEKIWTEIPSEGKGLFFTKLDLKDAYFHIELHEDVRHFTTFMSSNGLMRFKRLPFGLSCAPELFQKVMEKLMINCKGVIVYLDDILITASTLSVLEERVTAVKAVLKRNNLTVNESKSEYSKQKVDFLGFTIDGTGILPSQDKISDIKHFEKPKDVSELRSFLGMLTFISPFIENFSHKTKPLRDLTKSNSGSFKSRWASEQQEAFEGLKKAVEQDIVKRGFFDEKDKTILYSDASPWGLGAVLCQQSCQTEENRIIACASKSLTDTEAGYPQLHREALAIVWAMERFSYYLLGRQFTLKCDSKALEFMIKHKQHKDCGKRIMTRAEGWYLRLDHFQYNFQHIPGHTNIADAPSRIARKQEAIVFDMDKKWQDLCIVTADTNLIQEHLLAVTNEQVTTRMQEDEELQSVIKNLTNKERWPEKILKFQPFQSQMYVVGKILMKNEKMVLPDSLKTSTLRAAHRGHPGMSTMKNLLRLGVWWPKMDHEIEKYVESSPACQLVTKTSRPLPIQLTELPKNPWDLISMDFASASDVNKWKALVITDNYSRFLIAIPMDRTDTEAVKKVLKRVFQTYQIPKKIRADNGPPFNAAELHNWLQSEFGVKLFHSTPANPTENGMVERSMQGINKITAIAKLTKTNWKDSLAEYVAAYNTWPHSVTKIPPAELMFGRVVRTLLPQHKTDTRQQLDDDLRDLEHEKKFKRNVREDQRRGAQEMGISVGDKVLVQQQKKEKADTVYKNAFHEVVKITGEGRVTLKDLTDGRIYDRNVKVLKKFVDRDLNNPKTDGISEEKSGMR